MTIDELIQVLEDAKEQGLPGTLQVIIGDQPNYPFGCSISTHCIDETFEPALRGGSGEPETVLVLCEGSQLGYGNKAWWDDEDIRTEEQTVNDAYDEGHESAACGHDKINNPYSNMEDGIELHDAWNAGWDDSRNSQK
jgi:hypothetical protein